MTSQIFRRSEPGENDILTQIVYTPDNEEPGCYVRSVEKIKVFRQSEEALNVIESRKRWTRFGAAAGAEGLERGVSMKSHDEVLIEDPLSEEANKTGEERLIERIKATVKQKGTHRTTAEDGEDYESYVRKTTPSSRSNSNSRYRNSPGRFKPGGRNSPMNNAYRGPSPGRRSTGPPKGGRSPARSGQRDAF